jgi:CRP-like cAMP-binding protein
MADLDVYLPKLRKTMLFSGIDDSGITALTGCMNVQLRQYEKGDILVLAGFPVESVGILLTGGIEAVQEDREGRKLIINRMGPSEMFGEVLACSVRQKSPVTVYAIAQTQVLYIDYTRFSFSCEKACPHHTQALRNMMKIIADKYFTLNARIRLLTMRGIRERITAYLLENARLSGPLAT